MTQGRSGSLVLAVTIVISALVVTAGCTDSSPETLPSLEKRPVLDAAPFALSPGPPESAAFGDAVAVLNPAWGANLAVDSEGPAVAAWSPDGTWRELPEPDLVGVRRLLSTETGLVLLGVDGRRLQLQYLGLTDAEWTELDVPDMEFTNETEFWEEVSGEVAVMGTTSGWLVADHGAEVQLFESNAASNRRLCVVDGRLIELGYRTTVGGITELGALRELDPRDDEPRWEARANAPESGEVKGAAITCGPDGPVLLTGDAELSYDAATDQWTSRPAQAPGIVAEMLELNHHGMLADGTAYAVDPSGEVFRRSTSGEWTDTGIRGSQLVTTAAQAFAVGPDDIVAVS